MKWANTFIKVLNWNVVKTYIDYHKRNLIDLHVAFALSRPSKGSVTSFLILRTSFPQRARSLFNLSTIRSQVRQATSKFVLSPPPMRAIWRYHIVLCIHHARDAYRPRRQQIGSIIPHNIVRSSQNSMSASGRLERFLWSPRTILRPVRAFM